MKKWIARWLFGEEWTRMQYTGGIALPEEGSDKAKPTVRIGTMDVMNGKLLEVTSYKQNPRGPDWTTTYWIMDDRPLAEQIATVLVLKGLEK